MRIFVTGATGFVGSAVVRELVDAGYQVLGLTRSEEGAKALATAGAQAHRGDLADLESLRKGVAMSDGVIHLAFNHDFSKYAANCEADRRIIEALGSALAGSDRPLLVTSGTGLLQSAPGQAVTENDPPVNRTEIPRVATEEAVASAAAKGVRTSIVRLSQVVHNTVKQGLVSYMIDIARQRGLSAYVGDGRNRWPAVHLADAARLYRLALEKAEAGAKYHAVGEEGVTLRDMAEAIGRGLKIPINSIAAEKAMDHFGWLGAFIGSDAPASSQRTQQQLGWRPTGPGLMADLGKRFAAASADTASEARRARALS